MTPSIKALAIQAGMYVDVDGKPWPKWMGAEDCEKAYAKFAELIVWECGVALSPMLRDMVSGGQAFDLIKKHFGVE